MRNTGKEESGLVRSWEEMQYPGPRGRGMNRLGRAMGLPDLLSYAAVIVGFREQGGAAGDEGLLQGSECPLQG